MWVIIGFYSVQIVILLILLWLGWRFFDKRYKNNKKSSDLSMFTGELERTSEVFIDPKDGLKYRVYYNRKTGVREYVKEE